MAISVSRLQVAPVKGLELAAPATITLEPGGLREDRRFVLVSDRQIVLFRGDLRKLAGTSASYDEDASRLTLTFPDGECVSDTVQLGETLEARGYADRPVTGRVVGGRFADALSARLGRRVMLWHCAVGMANEGDTAVTLVSEASLAHIAERVGAARLDPARFRMTMHLSGLDAYAEDAWDGQLIRIGQAEVRLCGQIPRCVVTTWDPVTLRRDHDVLRTLLANRSPMSSGEPPFGMYASVVRPAPIRVGDDVTPA